MQILQKQMVFRWQNWAVGDVVVPTERLLQRDSNIENKAYKVAAFTAPPTPSMLNPFAGTVFLEGVPYGIDGDLVTLPRLETGGGGDQ